MRNSHRSIRAFLTSGSTYLIAGILVFEGVGLFHEPYDHLLSSYDRVLLERVGRALRGMPETDFHTTAYSFYVPRSKKATLRFALLEKGLLTSENGVPAELVDPDYLDWEDRLENPDYLDEVKAELESTIEDYLDGARVEIDIRLNTGGKTTRIGSATKRDGRSYASFSATATGETAS